MAIRERRERRKETLRREIMEAARNLFIKQGYESVSMRKIAEKIGYTPTTIYLYFHDKEDLIRQLCEETLAKLIRSQEALIRGRRDPVAVLKRCAKGYVEFGLQHPNHYQWTFIIPHTHEHLKDPQAREQSIGMKAFNNLRGMVAECVRQGSFRRVDVETTSQALWAAVHGITALLIGQPDFPWVEKRKLIDHTVETMMAGLRKD